MISKNQLVQAVRELYRELPRIDRAIFGLYHGINPWGERFTVEEIGEAMDMEYSEVSQRYETIMARLVDKLQE